MKKKIIHFDIDLDFASREEILKYIQYTPALLETGAKHNSGIYVTCIPQNACTGTASIDYIKAEELGYFKLDFLNNGLYKAVKSPEHLEQLLAKPINWSLLRNKEIVEQLIHIGNYYDTIIKLPEPIDSIEKLAMFMATIRPGKRHLLGYKWHIVEKTVWERISTEKYSYKRSHAIAYALSITLHMAILEEGLK